MRTMSNVRCGGFILLLGSMGCHHPHVENYADITVYYRQDAFDLTPWQNEFVTREISLSEKKSTRMRIQPAVGYIDGIAVWVKGEDMEPNRTVSRPDAPWKEVVLRIRFVLPNGGVFYDRELHISRFGYEPIPVPENMDPRLRPERPYILSFEYGTDPREEFRENVPNQLEYYDLVVDVKVPSKRPGDSAFLHGHFR